MKYTTITYIAKSGGGFLARVGRNTYEFEWQKGVGIGKRQDEIPLDVAMRIARWRDKKGKKIFVLE